MLHWIAQKGLLHAKMLIHPRNEFCAPVFVNEIGACKLLNSKN